MDMFVMEMLVVMIESLQFSHRDDKSLDMLFISHVLLSHNMSVGTGTCNLHVHRLAWLTVHGFNINSYHNT